MGDGVAFPLFVFEKDDCSMFLVEAPDKVLHQMEPVDIENTEYLFWDSNGKGVQISVVDECVTRISHAHVAISLSEALKCHSDAFGLNVDTAGPADEVWRRLKEAEAHLPRKRGLLSKVFGRVFSDCGPTSRLKPENDPAITLAWACWVVPLFPGEIMLQLRRMRNSLPKRT